MFFFFLFFARLYPVRQSFSLSLFATPWTWAQFPKWLRQLTTALGVTAATYILLIAKIRNWGTFGWGPRYLVPALPILFVAAGANLTVLWRSYRLPLQVLLGVSFLLNLAPVLVNWSLAIADPRISNAHLFFP